MGNAAVGVLNRGSIDENVNQSAQFSAEHNVQFGRDSDNSLFIGSGTMDGGNRTVNLRNAQITPGAQQEDITVHDQDLSAVAQATGIGGNMAGSTAARNQRGIDAPVEGTNWGLIIFLVVLVLIVIGAGVGFYFYSSKGESAATNDATKLAAWDF